VLPGLTGLAQLCGGYRATAAEKLRCDLVYLTSRSLGLDLRLIGVTLLDLVRGFPNA
jgi:lipopolysaccharide/colanic/teichoic acid biosynthesis glycosyltransferase